MGRGGREEDGEGEDCTPAVLKPGAEGPGQWPVSTVILETTTSNQFSRVENSLLSQLNVNC